MKEIAIDEARELVGSAALWPRVRDFLWDFLPQVHASWLDDLEWREALDAGDEAGPSHDAELMSSPRVRRFVLDSLGVAPCFHAFPKEDGSRLALLDGATLLALAQWLGALACAEDLRKVTDGATVRALKAALPGVYPEVFGYTAYFKGLASKDEKTATTADEIQACGFEILASAVSDVPAPVAARLKFKLPKRLGEHSGLRGGEGSFPRAFPTVLKLLKLKFPEAHALCCS